MFVQGSLHNWVTLVVLLHEHLKTGEGHSKHLCKLHWVDCVLLCVEHTRLLLLNVFQGLDLGIITSDSLILDLTLGLFVLDITLWELLPCVVDLLVD